MNLKKKTQTFEYCFTNALFFEPTKLIEKKNKYTPQLPLNFSSVFAITLQVFRFFNYTHIDTERDCGLPHV